MATWNRILRSPKTARSSFSARANVTRALLSATISPTSLSSACLIAMVFAPKWDYPTCPRSDNNHSIPMTEEIGAAESGNLCGIMGSAADELGARSQPRRDAFRQQHGHPTLAVHPAGDRAGVRAVAPVDVAAHGAANRPSGVLHHEQALEDPVGLRRVRIGRRRLEPHRNAERVHREIDGEAGFGDQRHALGSRGTQ